MSRDSQIPVNPIRWKVVIPADRDSVYSLLRTDDGRAKFWAEKTFEEDGLIEFTFPNGLTSRERMLTDIPSKELSLTYLGSRVTFRLTDLDTDLGRTCEVEVIDEGVPPESRMEVTAGWVSVLLTLKAYAGFQVDLRNHDPGRTWDHGYVDN